MAEKYKHKRIIALKSDGLVVEIDGKCVEYGNTKYVYIDQMLIQDGDAGWRVVSTNDTSFDGAGAIQYLLEQSAGQLRD